MLKEIFHKLFDVTTIKFVIVGIINTLFGYGIGLGVDRRKLLIRQRA